MSRTSKAYLAAVLAVFAIAAGSQAQSIVSISASPARPGEMTMAVIHLDQASALAGADIALTLPAFVSAGSATTTPATASFLVASHAESGRIEIAMACAEGVQASQAPLLQIPLRIERTAPAGEYQLTLDQVRLYDAQPGPIPAEARAGSLSILPPPVDVDNDGLPDDWELRYFGNTQGTANLDSDGDTMSDYQELLAGTDPAAPQSRFEVRTVPEVSVDGRPAVTIEWDSAGADENYDVQWSDGPVGDTMAWHPVYNPSLQRNGSILSWTDDGTRTHSAPAAVSARYYRIVLK